VQHKKKENSGIQRALLEETKRFIKNSKSGSRAFRGPKAGKSTYFTHPGFSAAKLKKKCRNYMSKYSILLI
jgi:hypothetical protein